MAVGKNKRRPKKSNKKKIVDPFTRKEWYDIKAPTMFANNAIGKTFVNQTQGKILAADGLKGRVFSVSLADLNKDEDRAYRTIRLVAEEVVGKEIRTGFHSMTFSSDKIKSLVKKWQTLIEARVEVKTTDGYTLRLFAIGFTKKRPNQVKITSYAQSSQVKQIRKKMQDIMIRESANCDIKALFAKFIPETIGKHIENECQGIYPLRDCFIQKAKIVRRPKADAARIAELYSATTPVEEQGTPVAAAETTTTTN